MKTTDCKINWERQEVQCPLCNKSIPWNNVQQGGLHIGCYEQEIEVYKISLGNTFMLDTVMPENKNEYDSIELVKMNAGKFYNLPEFEGW